MDIEIVERPNLINPDGSPILTNKDIFIPRVYQNTLEFRKVSINFLKYGKYTNARKGSKAYVEFWKEELRKCKYGMSVGGLWISGKHYFYMNYIPIKRIPDAIYLSIHPKASPTKKVLAFPSFWEIDLQWFYTKEACKQNAERGDSQAHIVCLKTRRGGFSYKEVGESLWNYYFELGSLTIFYAYSAQYLTKTDGIFKKAVNIMNFVNEHTEFKLDLIRGGDQSDYKESKIYGSKLASVVLDDEEKARGGDALKITLEEGGSFKNLISSWNTLLPVVQQEGITTGFMTVFGTGNNSKNDLYIEGLQEMFYNPSVYSCIAFDNIWDEGYETTECGFFVPATAIYEKYSDEHGNIDKSKALSEILNKREKLRGSKLENPNKIENPLCPMEALTRVHSTVFDIKAAKKARQDLLLDEERLNLLIHCRMTGTYKNPDYVVLTDRKGYTNYPVKAEDDKTSCVVIKEEPFKDMSGFVPNDMYFAVHDPYSKDQAEQSESIGSTYIFKRANNLDNSPYDQIVAWYNARPKKRAIYNKQLFLLLSYYNAKLQFEIDGGGQGIVEFASSSQRRLTHMLYHEPEMIHNKEIASKSKNRTYGVKMNVNKRATVFLEYLADLCDTTIGLNEAGQEIKWISTIDDEGLLNEIILYKDDRNADRLSSARLAPMMIRELEAIKVKEKKKNSNSLFNRDLYTDQNSNFGDSYLKTY